MPGLYEIKPLGDIKLTTQKFYRIDGGSTQLKGVIPDIILPDAYSYIEMGEKAHEFPMEWTEIAPVDHEQAVLQVKNINLLREKSAYRIKNNQIFSDIEENAQRLKAQRDDSSYPLNILAFQSEEAIKQAEIEAFEKLFETDVVPGVQNLPVDLPAFEGNESKQARNEEWIKDVKKDLHLQETLNIMQDMIAGK